MAEFDYSKELKIYVEKVHATEVQNYRNIGNFELKFQSLGRGRKPNLTMSSIVSLNYSEFSTFFCSKRTLPETAYAISLLA